MIQGVVNPNCEATISLVIRNKNRQTKLIDAVIDTGYTGFLSLPHEIIVALNLPWTGIDRGRDWSKDLVAKCHTKKSGKTYPGVYGRMEWDQPSPTIITQCFGFGNGRFGHPEQDRAISLREAALLLTFLPSYELVDSDKPVIFDQIGRLVGNTVPVKLGQVIAQSILEHVEKFT
jgi:site-specific DNA-cytosine methylase